MSEELPPVLKSNYRNRKEVAKVETPLSRFETMVDEYKALLKDKTHPSNRTAAYEKNAISVFNRLMVAADDLDGHNPGEGIFGLIILALRASLSLKDKNLELEVQVKELEKKIHRLEKR